MTAKGTGKKENPPSVEKVSISPETYSQLLENVDAVLWVSSPDWKKILYINPAYEKVWGRSCQSLYQDPLSWLECVHEEDRARLAMEVEDKASHHLDVVSSFKYRIRRPDGSVRWISARVYPVADRDGRTVRLAGIAEDVTAAMEATRALEEQKTFLGTVVDNIPRTYLSVIHRDLTIGFTAGPEFSRRGIDPSFFVGKTMEEVFAEQAPVVRDHYRKAFEGDFVQFELFTHGEHQEYRVVPLKDKDGRVQSLLVFVENVTARVESENALRLSEARFRKIIEASPMGMHMYRLETDGRLVFTGANPAADRILGVDNSRFVGMTLEEAFPPLAGSEVDAAYRRVCAEGVSWSQEQVQYEHGSIKGAFEVHAFPTAPGAMAVMFIEITERLKSQEEIRDSLKAKETLLKEIHHRVKNNLQVISSILEVQIHHLENPTYRRIFKESQNRILTMALIHQELYRAEDLASVNFGGFIRNLAQTLVGSYAVDSGKVRLELMVQDAELAIDTAIPCGLIINELIANCIKHAFPSGREGTIRIGFQQVGEAEYHMWVSDDGVGIPDDVDFRRSRSLGLQLVSMLSEQLGAEVTLERQGGTTFGLRFRQYLEAGTILHGHD